MKETGLMFKAPLVRSILDGSKTQTRRLVKPQPVAGQGMVNAAYCGDRNLWLRDGPCDKTDPAKEWRCPMGQPGDRIYVRETFCYQWSDERGWLDECWFRATTPDVEHPDGGEKSPWKPAIHMPKAVARIWPEITGVRVERLQQISEADCIAEGIAYDPGEGGVFHVPGFAGCSSDTATGAFQKLWESTGGDWAANPWVWVIDFRRDLAQGGLP